MIRSPGGVGVGARLLTLAGLALVWTVAWSTPAGQIGEDTKNDLYVDAWGLLRRALHLWDPQVTWGMLQNQGYGYLFPMGPFYAVLSEVLPVWVVQRLWWSVILTAGYLGTLALLRALGFGRSGAVHVGALAYALAPRVLSTLGAISPEAQTQLLAPVILLPLVLATAGRLGPRRAAALSGVAILCCGGVNATATLLAAVPAGLWLLTRRRWWRSALTWWWGAAAVAATAWWLGPLVLLGRYSPPFLDWIENASVILKPVGLLDVVKGTSHWLGHFLVTGGAWWPGGWALADGRSVVIAGSILGGLGLAGLALPIRHRGFLLLTLLTGLALLVIPHSGPLASPLAGLSQDLLDGPLAPLRNVHKADPLVRLPLTIGLVNVLRLLPRALPRPALAPALAGALVIVAAAPALGGQVATRGTFAGMPDYWRAAGVWLDRHADQGGAILLPSASFGEYTWGRTIDEPLRSLTTASYAVRDAVPLTPAGTIRFLDEIQRRAQSGRDLRGAAPALLAAGVKYVVLRGDLDTALTGGPPVGVTRSALLETPGVSRVAGFGEPRPDVTGAEVAPVEIFAITGRAAVPVTLWPAASVPVVSGASEALPALQESALAGGIVLFDGDATESSDTPRIETDTGRARTRYFGATRGADVTRTLTTAEAGAGTDYLSWPAPDLRSTVTYAGGISEVTATSAMSDQLTLAGLIPAHRPYAALDTDPATAWLAFGDSRPTLTVTFPADRTVRELRIAPARTGGLLGDDIAPADRVRVSIGGASADSSLDTTRGGRVQVPAAAGRELRIEILDTADGLPATALTGLSDVRIDDLRPTEAVRTPLPATSGPTSGLVLTRDASAFDGCVRSAEGYQCLGATVTAAEESTGLSRVIRSTATGTYQLSGTLVADPAHPSPALAIPGVDTVTASSTRTIGLAGTARAVLDSDPGTAWSPAPGDRAPRLAIRFTTPVRSTGLRVAARSDWLREQAPMAVSVTRGGVEVVSTLTRAGRIALPPATSSDLDIRLLADAGTDALSSLELSALTIDGFRPAAAGTAVGAACGAGPPLEVAGRSVPTSVLGERPALIGAGALVWQACEPVVIPAGETRVTLGSWQDMDPAQLVARQGEGTVTGSVAAAAQLPPIQAGAGGAVTATVEPAAYERVLAMTQNANAGWQARAGGRLLAPLVVDGYRQGFVVPAGVSGSVEVRFAPDGPYRGALAGGGLLALALLGAALWPGRRGSSGRSAGLALPAGARARGRPAGMGRRGRLTRAALIIAAGSLAAGWAGAAVALAVIVVTAVLTPPRPARTAAAAARVASSFPRAGIVPALVVVLVTVAGLVHAGWASGSGPGSPPVEIVTRLLTLAAVLLVLLHPARPARHRAPGAGAPPSA